MSRPRLTAEQLRSHRWFGVDTMRSFGHKSRAKQMGYDAEDYSGKPVIGIVNTWSDINPCHTHFRERVADVKRGVHQAGGFPLELPAMSLSEPFQKPTTMLYRNMLAMETEELLRSYPVDGCVLMGGCDKTTPGLIMGATSVDVPSLFLPAGPMLKGRWKGVTLGSGSDTWKYWAQRRAGTLGEREWGEIEDGIARSPGHCMTMGTASTMTAAAEALGLVLSGGSSIPAAFSHHPQLAVATGRRIVDLVWEDFRPREILTREAFENAVAVVMAMGGSTNAVIHLVAMAGRAEVDLPLEVFDDLSRRVPALANIRPSGEYLMEDFHDAGGLRGLMAELGELLHRDAITVTGRTLGDDLDGAEVHDTDVIRRRDNPLSEQGGLAVLRGSLAPDGCVVKTSAASPGLLQHAGRAVVFDSYEDMEERIDAEDLDVDENSVLVLRGAGPLGGPGMPEWGMLPIPKKLLQRGITDMVRISDARMSGTSYGTCVLHVAPESYAGGPLALVRDGDLVELDVPGRRLDLRVDAEELERRRAEWKRPEPTFARGYGKLFAKHITQADKGCDFDFLEGAGGAPEPAIH
ncbi:dihydroxy-acid dehydratase [Saccharopolyspora rhizosphaerae]|uniref:Dihydroxy-acid dehydratase n=1 Tax=Saccharopolyspora rhizosphaerae TaxID=2492662 RepID=A0A3R8R1Y2_9PSEU|nr:L-arabinonate dehydratase [Saccharopolyspora rhizosphaerae]RRO16255.1 dihydroxy-acid dehydratase [Saccharopolyspora rhizosphaerae]